MKRLNLQDGWVLEKLRKRKAHHILFKEFSTTNKSQKPTTDEKVLIPKQRAYVQRIGFEMPLTVKELILVKTYKANIKDVDLKATKWLLL